VEDAACGDLTTEALGLHGRRGHVVFFARGPMTIAGIELAVAMFMRRGVPVVLHRRSGEQVNGGAQLLSGDGDAADLHLVFKAAQTMVETLSGMATAARAMVDTVKAVNPNVRVACTRKAFPGGRRLSHVAVTAGGAILHRAGLSETILIFAEHRAFLRDKPLAAIVDRLRHVSPEKKIAIEVDDVAEAREAIDAGFDTLQLERFSVAAVGEVAELARARTIPPLIAAAGGVTVANAADYVRAGAGMIVTSAPFGAPPADVDVSIAEVQYRDEPVTLHRFSS
jgi:molybdenum transport protein